MKKNLQIPLSPVFLRAVYFIFLLVLGFLPGTIHAQWNTNTSVNLEISSLIVADMQSASTTDGKTWIAFYVQNGNNYDMHAQMVSLSITSLQDPPPLFSMYALMPQIILLSDTRIRGRGPLMRCFIKYLRQEPNYGVHTE